MSARMPTRRLGQSALVASRPRTLHWLPSTRRYISNPFNRIPIPFKRKEPEPNRDVDLSNPILEKMLEEQKPKNERVRPQLRVGGLSKDPSSVFLPEHEIPGWRSDLSPEEKERLKAAQRARLMAGRAKRERKLHELKLDPDPQARRRWERKKVIQGVKKRGRLTKKEVLARTERQSLYKSPFLPTSYKKLTRIMHLIAGKTVSEALIQLRFSKKRIARDVYKGLLIARDEAIAARGMGLGSSISQDQWAKQRDQDMIINKDSHELLADGTRPNIFRSQPELIDMKDGSKKLVTDPTEMYIDQAWVGRGAHTKSPEFRARGRINMLTHRTTSFSVLLKEERTRMRISEEIKKKRDNRKPWVALPDRPITTQRQYCLW